MPEDIEEILELASPRRTCPLALTCFGLGLGCLVLAGAIWSAVFLWMEKEGGHREKRHYLEPAPYVAATLGLTVLVTAVSSLVRLVRRRRELRGWWWVIGGVGLTVIGLAIGAVGFFLLTIEIR